MTDSDSDDGLAGPFAPTALALFSLLVPGGGLLVASVRAARLPALQVDALPEPARTQLGGAGLLQLLFDHEGDWPESHLPRLVPLGPGGFDTPPEDFEVTNAPKRVVGWGRLCAHLSGPSGGAHADHPVALTDAPRTTTPRGKGARCREDQFQ
ncbi:MAG: hypothetical protein ACI8PZ_004503 [Myxococcota bacterium]|jgi:hypothetical protein